MINLPYKFRPKRLEEFIGQKHLISPDKPLYKLIKKGVIPHSFFYGSTGTGKTTLAKIIASQLDSPFYEMDATNLKIEQIRKILTQYQNSLTKPIIFIDEVHRLSTTQQEVLLIPMENNRATIIGASTENPYFSLTAGIRSRSMMFEFFTLSFDDLEELVNRVQNQYKFFIEEDAKKYLINSSAGDCRALLNLLEFALQIDQNITFDILTSLRPKMLKDGISSSDTHYDLASAMIKSIRGSDINASLYYLGRLIDAGEGVEFISRRLVILASEDIGNANPNALNIATNTMLSTAKIGYPESRIILAQCVIFLASCPKSNSAYNAINQTLSFIENSEKLPIPKHLKGSGNIGYLYPHDFNGWVSQEYMTKPKQFYKSNNIGFEKTLDSWIEKIKKIRKN